MASEDEERVCALNVRYAALGRTGEVLPQIFFRALHWRTSYASSWLRHSVHVSEVAVILVRLPNSSAGKERIHVMRALNPLP